MPTIDKPVELSQALEKIVKLEGELQSAAEAVSTANVTIKTLTQENADLKNSVTEKETEFTEKLNSAITEKETLANELATERVAHSGDVETLNNTIGNLTAELATANEKIVAFEEVAATAKQEKEDLQAQNDLIAEQLQVRSLPPDIEDFVTGPDAKPKVSAATAAILTAKSPEAKLAARRAYNTNSAVRAQVDAELEQKTRLTPKASPADVKVSAEDRAIFEQWQAYELEANAVLAPYSSIPPVQRHRKHAELKVAGRKFAKTGNNQAAIDRVVSAQSRNSATA